jgi:hypothetical protein
MHGIIGVLEATMYRDDNLICWKTWSSKTLYFESL